MVVFPVAVVSFKPSAMHPIGDNTENVTRILVCCLLSLKKKRFCEPAGSRNSTGISVFWADQELDVTQRKALGTEWILG